MSFSSRLEFFDESGVSYPISISGTADNCLLTNFSYLLRNLNDYTITSQGIIVITALQAFLESRPIMLAEQMLEDDEDEELESATGQKKQ